ncbi:3'(2'),5'-bisphosphate nucleotidase 1 [Homalodisca vitripennis]|nr:3'(2'),5'-bisphosphate nucleotidase 1 [Homalodisca vitripennis]
MAQAPHLLIRILASATVTANFAGKIVRDVMNKGDLGIVDKGKNDLQTEADRSAQLCIIGSLSRQFPKITIIGEEGTSTCHCPEEWITTTSDQEVLSLSCPEQYHNLSESDHLESDVFSDFNSWTLEPRASNRSTKVDVKEAEIQQFTSFDIRVLTLILNDAVLESHAATASDLRLDSWNLKSSLSEEIQSKSATKKLKTNSTSFQHQRYVDHI